MTKDEKLPGEMRELCTDGARVKEHPILFSGPMVRAILAGMKTVTRRIAKVRGVGCDFLTNPSTQAPCPHGDPYDRLWVRETFRSWEETCATWGDWNEGHVCSEHCRQTYVAFAATPRVGYRPVPDRARITYLDESTPLDRNPRLLGPWRPSIFMPRAFSRLTLEIVGVRCERLQDIADEDIRAEGVTPEALRALKPKMFPLRTLTTTDAQHLRACWEAGWNAINSKRAPWASNPWVWRVEFRRLP